MQTGATQFGSFYAIKLEPSAQYDFLGWGASDADTTATNKIAKFRGRTVTFGMWVNTSTADDLVLALSDNTATSLSGYHSGGGGWEWLQVTRTYSPSATYINACIIHYSATPGTGYFTQPMLVFGNWIIEGKYQAIKNEVIWFDAPSFLLANYNPHASVSADTFIYIEPVSNGKIPKGVKAVHFTMQATQAAASQDLYLIGVAGGNMFNIKSQVANIANTTTGWVRIYANGTTKIVRGVTWTSVYIWVNGIQY